MRRPVVGVMGGHVADAATTRLAEELGAAIAEQGWILLNGGRDQGIMAATARGARQAGGFVVGVLPGDHNEPDVAPDLDLRIFTGMGFARNMINVLSSDVLVAIKGSHGTLNEVAYAMTFGKPVVLFGFDDHGAFGDDVERVDDLEACIAAVADRLPHLDAPEPSDVA